MQISTAPHPASRRAGAHRASRAHGLAWLLFALASLALACNGESTDAPAEESASEPEAPSEPPNTPAATTSRAATAPPTATTGAGETAAPEAEADVGEPAVVVHPENPTRLAADAPSALGAPALAYLPTTTEFAIVTADIGGLVRTLGRNQLATRYADIYQQLASEIVAVVGVDVLDPSKFPELGIEEHGAGGIGALDTDTSVMVAFVDLSDSATFVAAIERVATEIRVPLKREQTERGLLLYNEAQGGALVVRDGLAFWVFAGGPADVVTPARAIATMGDASGLADAASFAAARDGLRSGRSLSGWFAASALARPLLPGGRSWAEIELEEARATGAPADQIAELEQRVASIAKSRTTATAALERLAGAEASVAAGVDTDAGSVSIELDLRVVPTSILGAAFAAAVPDDEAEVERTLLHGLIDAPLLAGSARIDPSSAAALLQALVELDGGVWSAVNEDASARLGVGADAALGNWFAGRATLVLTGDPGARFGAATDAAGADGAGPDAAPKNAPDEKPDHDSGEADPGEADANDRPALHLRIALKDGAGLASVVETRADDLRLEAVADERNHWTRATETAETWHVWIDDEALLVSPDASLHARLADPDHGGFAASGAAKRLHAGAPDRSGSVWVDPRGLLALLVPLPSGDAPTSAEAPDGATDDVVKQYARLKTVNERIAALEQKLELDRSRAQLAMAGPIGHLAANMRADGPGVVTLEGTLALGADSVGETVVAIVEEGLAMQRSASKLEAELGDLYNERFELEGALRSTP